jgi:hypothetical protein
MATSHSTPSIPCRAQQWKLMSQGSHRPFIHLRRGARTLVMRVSDAALHAVANSDTLFAQKPTYLCWRFFGNAYNEIKLRPLRVEIPRVALIAVLAKKVGSSWLRDFSWSAVVRRKQVCFARFGRARSPSIQYTPLAPLVCPRIPRCAPSLEGDCDEKARLLESTRR